MSWQEFRDWQAYSRISPIGGERLDMNAASIVAAIYNVHRNIKEHPQPFQPADVVLQFRGQKERDETPEERNQRLATMMGIFSAGFGGSGMTGSA